MTPVHSDDPRELAALVRSLVVPGRRFILGIAGEPGAGKSTVTQALVAELGAAHVPLDGFHLAKQAIAADDRSTRRGAIDTFDGDGYLNLLQRLRSGRDEVVYAPDFDRSIEEPIGSALPIERSAEIVISEGNYLLAAADPWPAARALFDEVWFVQLDPAVRRERLIRRHIEFGKTPLAAQEFVLRSDEANAALIAPTAAGADRIVQR